MKLIGSAEGAGMATLNAWAPAGRENLSAQLGRVADDLAHAHPEIPPQKIHAMVETSASSLREGAKLTEFIPVLVRTQVATALRRSAA